MSNLMVEEKDVVVPGEILAQGMDFVPAQGCLRENDKIIASQLGLVNLSGRLIKVIQLSGRYIPKKGDVVIGKVVDIGFSGWRVDIGWAFEANLSMKEASSDFIDKKTDLTQYYTYGDIIAAQITYIFGSKIIDLTMKGPGLRKLKGGRIIRITPSKVPRVIGKQGSMISMIKEKTGCRIIVGQNGLVWIQGDDSEKMLLAVDTIYKIEEEAHLSGLTDRIKSFLEDRNGSSKKN